MPRKKYHINLNNAEHQTLQEMTRKGTLKARKFKRAMILLKADEGLSDPQIMVAVNVSRPTVERIRKRFVEGYLERALNEDSRPGQKRKLDGRGEAQLIAMACSQAPAGHDHWTLRLFAGKLVELDVVESMSYETVRRTLKKRPEALAETDVVHPKSQRRVCSVHGRCSRSIRTTLRSSAPIGML